MLQIVYWEIEENRITQHLDERLFNDPVKAALAAKELKEQSYIVTAIPVQQDKIKNN